MKVKQLGILSKQIKTGWLSLTLVVVAVISQQTFFTNGARADDSSEIQARGYSDPDRPEIKTIEKKGSTEMTVNYPEDAKGFVASMKMMLQRQHHKGSFKQTDQVWILTDDTAKKSWIIKSRHATSRKKPDTKGLQALAELYPRSASVLYEVSGIFEAQKNWPLALEYYKKASDLEASSCSPEVLTSSTKTTTEQNQRIAICAYFELMMGHYATAIKELSKAIELEPYSISNYKNRAEAYRKLNKLDLAAQDERKLQGLFSAQKAKPAIIQGSGMPISAALLYVKLGGYDQVVKTADDELKLDSLSKLAHLARARALLRLGKYQPALADYRALLLLTKDAPTIKEEMAIAESLAKQAPAPYGDLSLLPATDEKRQRKFPALRNGKKVVVSVAQLASDHKGDYRVYSAICGALKQKSMLKPLSSELDKMLAIDPADSSAVGSKIEATEALRNWPEAEKSCTRYTDLMASGAANGFKLDFIAYVYTVRALARRARKNCAGAIDDETTVLKLEPDSAQAFCDRGDCYMQCGKYDQAVADYSKSIQFDDTKTGGIYLRRAKAYDKLKKTDLAQQDRETAAKLSSQVTAPKAIPD